MKKTTTILIFLLTALGLRAQVGTISNGEAMSSVRSKMNAVILQSNTNATDIATAETAIDALEAQTNTWNNATPGNYAAVSNAAMNATATNIVQDANIAANSATNNAHNARLNSLESGTNSASTVVDGSGNVQLTADSSGVIVTNLDVLGTFTVDTLAPEVITLNSSEDFQPATNVYWITPPSLVVENSTIAIPIGTAALTSPFLAHSAMSTEKWGGVSSYGGLLAKYDSGLAQGNTKVMFFIPNDSHTNISISVYYTADTNTTEDVESGVFGYSATGNQTSFYYPSGGTAMTVSDSSTIASLTLPLQRGSTNGVALPVGDKHFFEPQIFRMGYFKFEGTVDNDYYLAGFKVLTW